MPRILALLMLLSAAARAAAPRACKVDSDCASSELCDHGQCVGRGWGTAREKAEQNAGMGPNRLASALLLEAGPFAGSGGQRMHANA
jgi:hypothetical protein